MYVHHIVSRLVILISMCAFSFRHRLIKPTPSHQEDDTGWRDLAKSVKSRQITPSHPNMPSAPIMSYLANFRELTKTAQFQVLLVKFLVLDRDVQDVQLSASEPQLQPLQLRPRASPWPDRPSPGRTYGAGSCSRVRPVLDGNFFLLELVMQLMRFDSGLPFRE
jgi:hypothetical protein